MLSKKLILILFLFTALVACDRKEDYQTDSYLPAKQQSEILRKVLPNFAKLPKGFTYERRFDTLLNTFYTQEIKKYKFQHYYISEDSTNYFMVTRPAPSLYKKRIAIAGKFKKDKQGNITEYEEVFWTFKMKDEELTKKSLILFAEMVKGGDLSQYMPGKKQDEWIEFPDARCSYDKKKQKWVVLADNNSLMPN